MMLAIGMRNIQRFIDRLPQFEFFLDHQGYAEYFLTAILDMQERFPQLGLYVYGL